MDVDWAALRGAATEVMRRAYAPYSRFPVGAAGLVDDGRVVVGCNVENAAYGVVLCAECGVVSALHSSGGGSLVALSCVDGNGAPLMPCGRCRQLLWEHGGPNCLVDAGANAVSVAELLPAAFGVLDLQRVDGEEHPPPAGAYPFPSDGPPEGTFPADLATMGGLGAASVAGLGAASAAGLAGTAGQPADAAELIGDVLPGPVRGWLGRGAVFVHPDLDGGRQVWTGYWERSDVFARPGDGAPDAPSADQGPATGILQEAPYFDAVAEAVAWGRRRTPTVVVVRADGSTAWAGEGDPPTAIQDRWADPSTDGEPSG